MANWLKSLFSKRQKPSFTDDQYDEHYEQKKWV
jgi:hypothetical protein